MKNIILFALLSGLLILPLAHADITSDLRAWYKFDNNLRDSTDYYNDGIAITPDGLTYVDGKIGRALHLNNTYSAVNIGNDTSLQIDGNMTFSAWMYSYQNTGGYIISKAVWYGDNGEYDIQFSFPSYDNYLYFGRNLDYRITSCPFVSETWQHLTITTNETDTKFYINGSLIFEDTGLIASSNTSGNAWIGNFPPEGAYGQDVIYDDVRLYNRTLTYDEVEELYAYNGTTPTTTTTIGGTTTTITPSGISYSTCATGNILHSEIVTLVLNGTETTNQTAIREDYCEYGCVQTGNYTAICQPSLFDSSLYIGGILAIILIFFVLIIIAVKKI